MCSSELNTKTELFFPFLKGDCQHCQACRSINLAARQKRGKTQKWHQLRDTRSFFFFTLSCFSRAFWATSAEGDQATLSTLPACTLAHHVLRPANFTFNFLTHNIFGLCYHSQGCTWTGCLTAHTGPCVWARQDQMEPHCPAGVLKCIWRGGRRRSPAFSAEPVPSAAASSTRRDTEESLQADLQ